MADWTPERIKLLQHLIKQGMAASDIQTWVSKQFNTSTQDVSNQLRKLGYLGQTTTNQDIKWTDTKTRILKSAVGGLGRTVSKQDVSSLAKQFGTSPSDIIKQLQTIRAQQQATQAPPTPQQATPQTQTTAPAQPQTAAASQPAQNTAPPSHRRRTNQTNTMGNTAPPGRVARFGRQVLHEFLGNFGMIGGFAEDLLTGGSHKPIGQMSGSGQPRTPRNPADLTKLRDTAQQTLDEQRNLSRVIGTGLENVSRKFDMLTGRVVSALATIGVAPGGGLISNITPKGGSPVTGEGSTKTAFGEILGGALGLGAMGSAMKKVAMVAGGAALGIGGMLSFFGGPAQASTEQGDARTPKPNTDIGPKKNAQVTGPNPAQSDSGPSADQLLVTADEIEFKTDTIKFDAKNIIWGNGLKSNMTGGGPSPTAQANQPSFMQKLFNQPWLQSITGAKPQPREAKPTQPDDMSGGKDSASGGPTAGFGPAPGGGGGTGGGGVVGGGADNSVTPNNDARGGPTSPGPDTQGPATFNDRSGGFAPVGDAGKSQWLKNPTTTYNQKSGGFTPAASFNDRFGSFSPTGAATNGQWQTKNLTKDASFNERFGSFKPIGAATNGQWQTKNLTKDASFNERFGSFSPTGKGSLTQWGQTVGINAPPAMVPMPPPPETTTIAAMSSRQDIENMTPRSSWPSAQSTPVSRSAIASSSSSGRGHRDPPPSNPGTTDDLLHGNQGTPTPGIHKSWFQGR